MSAYFVVPEGIDDPLRPSGGNHYDRRVNALLHLEELATTPDRLGSALTAVPSGSTVLIDGLLASPAVDIIRPASARLKLVVLVHMPLFDEVERGVLRAAAAVVTTSSWTRSELLRAYDLDPRGVHVAVPGVDLGAVAPGTPGGGRLLCVAAVAPHKGHDVLLAALDLVDDLDWDCTCVGSLDRDRSFVAGLANDRVLFGGPRVGDALATAYAAADLLVLPSRAETFGMVITEALARGLPVLASDVGGVREALGDTGASLLVAPGDVAALAAALRAWLTRPELRGDLRTRAIRRRDQLPGWDETAGRIAAALNAVSRSSVS
ncbi:MAG TPA: glycosyltransferase family 4 protein [Jatrophihabitans sp.]